MSPYGDEYRTTRSLDGMWQFVTDPEDDGDGRGLVDSEGAWTDPGRVTVPHAWQEIESLREYTGTAWYRRTVEYDGAGDRVFLRFGAVDYEATVYVNGQRLGVNRGGYLPFEVEVTGALTTGENAIVVKVTDPADLDEIPHGKQGDPWYIPVSGIWQSVTLETRPERFVDDVKVTPDLDDDTANIAMSVDGETADLDAVVTVARNDTDVASATCDLVDGHGASTLHVPDAEYWTPDDPVLYDVTVEIRNRDGVVDVTETYFGMRSVSSDGNHVSLNGDPFYVRGALDQAYYPDTLYRPFDEDLFEAEIRTAKELGFNLLRKHIKPAHPDFVEAADRLGILVWEETANPTGYSEGSREALQEQVRGMIDRDYNSPSVVAWSLYNEEWGIGAAEAEDLWADEEKQAYLTELYHEAKERDPTRLVCDNSGWAHVATDLNDYHEYYVSPDRDGAWADRLDDIVASPADNYAVEHTSAADAPVIVSEFGTWGFPDLAKLRDHYGGDPPWFSHDFLEDPLKRPAGVDDRFEATNLPAVFDGYDDLAAAWQRRQSISLAGVIERMRTRDAVAGYVVTQFSDIEWEFNGILDYLRDPKAFADEFAAVNADVVLSVDPETHVLEPGEERVADVRVVNDTGQSFAGELRWDGAGSAGTAQVSVDAFGTTTVEDALALEPEPDAETGPRTVAVTLETDDRKVTAEERVFVVASESPDATVYAEGSLAEAFVERGVAVTDALEAAEIAVVTELDAAVSAFVERGNAAVVIPRPDGRMAETVAVDVRNLPAGESWNLVSSLLYQDSPLLDGLVADARIGWAFEELFPYDLVENMTDGDEVHVGSVEGWLANRGSALVGRDHGDGRLYVCTFRVTDRYGDHPTATALLDRLVETAQTD